MIPTRTFDYLEILKHNYPKENILARCKGGKWQTYSVDDYIAHSRATAYGLLAKGYQPGDKIVAICSNCPEWNFLDMGCTLARLVFVPIYPTLSADDFEYIFTHSDARAIFFGTEVFYNKVSPIAQKVNHPIDFYLMDSSDTLPCLKNLMALGREQEPQWKEIIDTNIQTVSPDEVASLIYTSGTTGRPKGVMLTHRNLTFNAHSHAVRQTKNSSHRMVSFLPLCHVYERSMNYEYQELGISIYYAEGLGTIARDLASCHADGFCAVPRVLEMMYDTFSAARNKLKGPAKLIYQLAWNFGNNFEYYNHSYWYTLQHRLYDKLVYSKWRQALGGHEMLVVSGGSSIRPCIVKLFNAAKLHIFEGYGMTEASPVIAVNSPADGINIIGTVGKPIGGSELAFAEDGEILTRGPHVMKGYYKDPEATREVIDADGWLHTGDIGFLQDGKYLKITDRKKEIFKLSSGKYITPQVIENKLRESAYIENCMVIGEHQKFASALIVVSAAKLKEWAKNKGKHYANDDALLNSPEVLKLLNNEVEKVNATLASYEIIKKPRYFFDDWSSANNLLSQTLKLKRRNILKKYQQVIDSIYTK